MEYLNYTALTFKIESFTCSLIGQNAEKGASSESFLTRLSIPFISVGSSLTKDTHVSEQMQQVLQ